MSESNKALEELKKSIEDTTKEILKSLDDISKALNKSLKELTERTTTPSTTRRRTPSPITPKPLKEQ